MVKLVALLTFVLFAVTGCGGGSASPNKFTKPAIAQSSDLSGSWATGDKSDPKMAAEITTDSIVLTWIQENNTKALYWTGTFASAADGQKVVSNGDREAMDSALFASGAATKTFTYKNNKLSYDFTIMGVTKTLSLSKE